jgi:hypothetical protein
MTFAGSDEPLPVGDETPVGDDDLAVSPFVRRMAHLQIAFVTRPAPVCGSRTR